ncbi:VOC family protein [Bradyrhizobium sp. BR 10289]|uniref:VOC family protein n=1 Tax=Bradyrhizobium sp. BR 10289 TaxID=2749993 RepID=UPI001C6540C6|nr:VOC family protein [Bradyrhizobium sp. BR 10289]MBW7970230.1 VOC family protein [Bradyrhizobium sp. BR 10289]
MTEKARLVALNHVALEVEDVQAALEFYGSVFLFQLRGSHKDVDGSIDLAFIDMGDQFLALSRGSSRAPDRERHFGLVVDDRTSVMANAISAGAHPVDGRDFNFLDPWGNRIEVVEYCSIQFIKSDAVLKALSVDAAKNDDAKRQLREKGFD